MTRPKIQIRQGEHVSIVGATGSGKTHLASLLVREFPNAIIHDEKGRFPASGVVRVPDGLEHDGILRRIADVKRVRGGRWIYRPQEPSSLDADDGELGDIKGAYEELFEFIYRTRNRVLLIDETYSVTNGPQGIGRWLKALLTRGRELKISVISLSQRPKEIPNFLLSESTHHFIFRTALDTDLKKIAGYVGKQIWEPLDRYHFHYFNIADRSRDLLNRVAPPPQ